MTVIKSGIIFHSFYTMKFGLLANSAHDSEGSLVYEFNL